MLVARAPVLRHNVVVASEEGRLDALVAVLRKDGHDVRARRRAWEIVRMTSTWPAHVVVIEVRADTLYNLPLLEPLLVGGCSRIVVIAERGLAPQTVAHIRDLALPIFFEPLDVEALRIAVQNAGDTRFFA